MKISELARRCGLARSTLLYYEKLGVIAGTRGANGYRHYDDDDLQRLRMVQARQPVWVERAGRTAWRRVQPLVRAPGGLMVAGLLWALMPCGLLYSALLVAALSGGALQGAVTMLLFGVGSGLWLVGGPWLWGRLRTRINAVRASWGTRLAGALLVGVAGWALWMDLIYKPSLWCR